MISTKEVKIDKSIAFDSGSIEEELKRLGYDVLRWAITDFDDKTYTLSLAVVEK